MDAIQGKVEKEKINRGALEPEKENNCFLLWVKHKREHKDILYVIILGLYLCTIFCALFFPFVKVSGLKFSMIFRNTVSRVLKLFSQILQN